jgi:hypothetical protein
MIYKYFGEPQMKKSLLIAFILLLIIPVNSNSQYLKDYLIAYWSFDDSTANDQSGNGYHGTMVNNPIPVPGVKGLGMKFSGKGDFLNPPYQLNQIGSHILLPRIKFEELNEFTISLWVNEISIMSGTPGEGYIFFGNHVSSWFGILHHTFSSSSSNKDLQFAVGATQNIEPLPIISAFNNSYQNKWVHYVLVYKDSILSAYINNELIGQKKQVVDIAMDSGAIARHWWHYDGVYYRTSARLTAVFDEVKIYKKALTDDEIENEHRLCTYEPFKYENFSNVNNILFSGDAVKKDNFIRLTPADYNKSGAVWYYTKLPVGDGFTTDYSFKFSNGNNALSQDSSLPGADGIVFVIQNFGSKPLGLYGHGIGYHGIPNALAIELDTYANDEKQMNNNHDPNGNHLAVMCSSNNPVSSDHNSSSNLAVNESILTIQADKIYYARIEYDNILSNLKVYLDTINQFTKPVLVLGSFDLSKNINLDKNGSAYMGFTAATGSAYENHDLLSWKICLYDKQLTDIENNNIKDNEIYPAPNPFDLNITFNYEVINPSNVGLNIYDFLGRNIYCLISEFKESGKYTAIWNSNNYSAGFYFYTLKIGNEIISGKIMKRE